LKSEKPVAKYSQIAQDVYLVTSMIPRGRVSTYGAIAREIGRQRASRAVGRILRSNPWPEVPCHRVVNSNGKVGGYGSEGISKKIELLASEGVEVRGIHIQNFKFVKFDDFASLSHRAKSDKRNFSMSNSTKSV
jgi:methylated-DNA-[protein]-cysteine S-methyltransferase